MANAATNTTATATATVSNTWGRQAITTKSIGPTNYRGQRVKATAAAGNITVHWDYELDTDANHAAAAIALANKMNWGGQWVMGGAPNGEGNVYVCPPRS